VPYKDPEARRQYDRDYKKRCRAQEAINKATLTPRKAYLWFQRPHQRWAGIAFVDGWFITADPEKQATIEANELYGKEIFSWRVEP